jgi:DNA-binding MarR family transcriptional regulator
MAAKDPTDEDYRALAEFRYQLRRFLHFSEQAARRAGLEPAQHQLLLAVKAHDGAPTVSELAERLQLRHHSVVGLIDRLAVHKLVRRTHPDKDRRQVRVRLTAKGEAVLGKLATEHRSELGGAGTALVAALRAILDRE